MIKRNAVTSITRLLVFLCFIILGRFPLLADESVVQEDHVLKEDGEKIAIQIGDSGETVKGCQEMLIKLEFLVSVADGDFGPKTEQAVIDFQNDNGLSPSGIIDDETYDQLQTAVIELTGEIEYVPSLVWIPISGARYHSYSTCGGLKNAKLIMATEAEENGYKPCNICSGGQTSKEEVDPVQEASTPQTKTEMTSLQEDMPTLQEVTYVCNTNTRMFHLPFCGSVTEMNAKNKQEMCCDREVLIAQGYEPCGNCHP